MQATTGPGAHGARRFLIAGFVCLSVALLFGERTPITFDTDDPGRPPTGFAFVLTGQGRPGVWLVRKDDAAHGNVLVQTDTDPTADRFPVAVYNDFSARDVDLTVQFKPVSGRGDQGAGLVWRYRDPNNYYLARCNALEDACTIYRVVNGQREALSSQNVQVGSAAWHTLRVEAGGDHFVVAYDGTKVLDVKDGTFSDAGKVGLWTKADSLVYFDDFSMVSK
jgi:hypothetical protein